jgi:hypothetical protein
LRSAAAGEQLIYEPLRSGVRVHGARPPKLEPLERAGGVRWVKRMRLR